MLRLEQMKIPETVTFGVVLILFGFMVYNTGRFMFSLALLDVLVFSSVLLA